MLIVSKSILFDAAHLLTGHAGQCRNLHGHTYRVTVDIADTHHLPNQPSDMVIDFKELKHLLQKLIAEPCDHAFLYDTSSDVETDIAETLKRHDLRVYPIACRSTSENLAKHFYQKLREQNLPVLAVTVSEAPESRATYRED